MPAGGEELDTLPGAEPAMPNEGLPRLRASFIFCMADSRIDITFSRSSGCMSAICCSERDRIR